MANLYFAERTGSENWNQGTLVTIIGDEARHAVRVSRLRVGEQILVGDGVGVIGEGTVESVAKDSFVVRLEGVLHDPEPMTQIVLVQALAKGDRDERAVEQATEFGVDGFVPWQAERSVSRWSSPEKLAKGVAKWARIAREASKQSLRSRIPVVQEPLALDGLRTLAASDAAHVVVLHPRGSRALSDWRPPATAGTIYLVVGPEGGLSDAELDTLEAAGAEILVLGDTVLRTSSAGPAALAVLNVSLGRW
ncbi:16S rRNA (uracil(1498)-N(3))-methyltransferase [Leucobacter coleopterorum]|uniref:Ribosomal RNA small subunit methyltransferase E n=1 Tax=Leucobacter coleopterorum TaxID=2714933 RepID=A0ABX6JW68_9MICO|nr:16S rRNA (uracil(1498)-N(3))-methyltransferase [Leucobacter coleopterorum]QIM18551.1 16S rRNA (uracil(1498)-N(3))-methyltransferase [Leucobacter coleopterorum]